MGQECFGSKLDSGEVFKNVKKDTDNNIIIITELKHESI